MSLLSLKKNRLETIIQVHTYILHITATCFGYLNVAIVRLYRELYNGNVYMNDMCFKTSIFLLCLEHYD